MRWLQRLAILTACLVIAGALILALTGHQLGPRPSSSVAQLKPRADVQYITANSLQFAYLEQGEGPLVLMFHGYPETAASWDHVQATLANAGYRTVAVYMRGYPPTSHADDYSIGVLGQDVAALIEAFGEDQAIVVGHDWGASAVYEAAYIEPEKISHLIALSAPHPLGISANFNVVREAPHFLYYQSPFAERLVWSHNFAHIRKIYDIWSPGFDVPDAEIEDIVTTFKHPVAIKGALGYYRALVANGDNNSKIDADSKIGVPALIFAGTNDGATPARLFEAAAPAFIGEYQLKILNGVGHFPQIETPDQVADTIIAFLEG